MGDLFAEGHFPEGHFPDGHFPSLDAAPSYPPTVKLHPRAQFVRFASYITRLYPVNLEAGDYYLFAPVVKDPAAAIKLEPNLYPLCAAKWRPNEDVSANEFVLPNFPTGFSYEATTAGRSGSKEPRWPTVAAATVQDGSITWTCRAAGSNAIYAISEPEAESDPAGLTVGTPVVAENFKIQCDVSGGDDGSDYDVVFTWTLNGQPRTGRVTVQVRKQ